MEDLSLKLEKLAGKQVIWQKTPPEEKLHYLESALDALVSKVKVSGLKTLLGERCADMKQVNGKERDLIISEEAMFAASAAKGYLEALCESYRVRIGSSEVEDKLTDIQAAKVGQQVVAKVFPLIDKDKQGPLQGFEGEIWFDPETVKETTQAKPFQFDALDDKKDGVMVVLGAGNYTLLTTLDILHAMFVRNRVVFCKNHPLRPFVEDFHRIIFAPLYEKGFLDSENDQGIERSLAICNSPFVTSVHMTGGKATHDAIVWGSTAEEQSKNKQAKTPKLANAEMTSELGCNTPYIMTPTEYTPEELQHQARTLIGAKWCNGSASCNAPQTVLVSKNWKQRDAFVSALEEAWESASPIRTYYPGISSRWEAFRSAYPNDFKTFHSNAAGDGQKETHLPLLMIYVDADLSTDDGRGRAVSEYAFQHEAFAPVLTIVTVEDGGFEDFMEKAVDLSNNYIFGTLSCSMAVPPAAEKLAPVEKAIADLKYGAIVLNAWSAHSYLIYPLTWGGVYGEQLESVESGIGQVVNSMFFSNVEKSVLRTPVIHPMHFDFCKPIEEITGFNNMMADMLLGGDAGGGGAGQA